MSPERTRRGPWSGAHDRCRGATCWRPSESRSGTAVPCPRRRSWTEEGGSPLSERSERVGRPSDAPPASGLATGAAAERATTTPPQDPPAPTIPQRSWPVYEGVRVRPPTTSVVGELDRERLHPEREDSPVSVEVRRGRRVLRSGGSGRSRGSPTASTASASLATAANALTAFAHERPLLRTTGTRLRRHGTAVPLRLSLAGSSRFAPSTSPSAPSSLWGRARSL